MVLLTGEPLGQRRSLKKKGGHEPPPNKAKPQKQEHCAQNGPSRFCAVLLVAAQNRKQACHVDAVAKSQESLAQARFPRRQP